MSITPVILAARWLKLPKIIDYWLQTVLMSFCLLSAGRCISLYVRLCIRTLKTQHLINRAHGHIAYSRVQATVETMQLKLRRRLNTTIQLTVLINSGNVLSFSLVSGHYISVKMHIDDRTMFRQTGASFPQIRDWSVVPSKRGIVPSHQTVVPSNVATSHRASLLWSCIHLCHLAMHTDWIV